MEVFMDYNEYFKTLNEFHKKYFDAPEENLKYHLIVPLFTNVWGLEAKFNHRYNLSLHPPHIFIDLMLGKEIWIETKKMSFEPDTDNSGSPTKDRLKYFKTESDIKILILTNGLKWIVNLKNPINNELVHLNFTLSPTTYSLANKSFPKLIDKINQIRTTEYKEVYQSIVEAHKEMTKYDDFNLLLKNKRKEMINDLVEKYGGTNDLYELALTSKIE